MRDILFKAKRKDNSEWVEGSYVYTFNEDKVCPVVGVMSENHWIAEKDGNIVLIDKDTICQYTGLTDKNGNKIWENDVVKKHFYTDYDAFANSEEYFGVVKFTDYAWVIETKRDNRVCVRPIIESISYSEDVKHFEVIGNIFDNPELIGE